MTQLNTSGDHDMTVAKIKNISGEDRIVPWLGGRLVLKDAVVEVDADQVTAFTQQEGTWAPADAAATARHEEMLVGIAELLAEPVLQEASETMALVASTVTSDKPPSAKAVIAEVGTSTDRASLAALRALEERPSVVKAIDARLAELGEDEHDPDGGQDADPGSNDDNEEN